MNNQNKIFTTEFINSFNSEGKYFDRDFLKKISTKSDFQEKRDRIDRIVSLYPEKKATELISSFRKSKNQECRSIIAELHTFEILVDAFGIENIIIEEPIDILDGKTPDFNINNKVIFEVFCVLEEPKHIEAEIREIINKIKAPFKVWLDKIYGIPKKGSLSTRDIRIYFEKLFSDNEDLIGVKEFSYKSKKGIELKGRLFSGDDSGDTLTAISQNYGEPLLEYRSNLIKTIRSRTNEKVNKYNKLGEANIPLILVIFDYLGHHLTSRESWKRVFTGDEFNIDGSKNEYPINKIFKKRGNTSLTCALVLDKHTERDFYLFKNPNAKVNLKSKLEELIIKNFRI